MSQQLRTWFKVCLSTGLAIALLLISVNFQRSPAVAEKYEPPESEIRGVWITNVASGVLFAPWGIDRAMRQLAQLNFNTVYPVVWNRGHTFYPSQVARQVMGRSQDPWISVSRPFQDLLMRIVRQGYRRQLRVIPWFEYGFMAPAHSLLVKRHPEWLTSRRDNTQALKEVPDEQIPQESVPQSPDISSVMLPTQVWLNPLHPEVQKFFLDLVIEVVNNYAVDGIQLDDHFGMPVELGYDSFTIKLYQQEHNGKSPPDNPTDAEWMRWRANKITKFMEHLSYAVKSVKPRATVSLSPNSHYFAYQNYLQDWQTWVDRGFVDELILQVYRDDLKTFNAELKQPAIQKARQKIPVGVGITTGTWRNPVSIKQIQQQVQESRQQKFDGVSFFYWESLWSYLTPESPQERRNIFAKLMANR
jgi:uncharacterized lipoprotein YddW (UPF0748 family)